mmetsp:Transcript_90053/g.251780  ORF Transcript_90053/g.251780 Transcript_90053/m.251780 type:complete len:394 (-) Transcript_90053:350-1531(-)
MSEGSCPKPSRRSARAEMLNCRGQRERPGSSAPTLPMEKKAVSPPLDVVRPPGLSACFPSGASSCEGLAAGGRASTGACTGASAVGASTPASAHSGLAYSEANRRNIAFTSSRPSTHCAKRAASDVASSHFDGCPALPEGGFLVLLMLGRRNSMGGMQQLLAPADGPSWSGKLRSRHPERSKLHSARYLRSALGNGNCHIGMRRCAAATSPGLKQCSRADPPVLSIQKGPKRKRTRLPVATSTSSHKLSKGSRMRKCASTMSTISSVDLCSKSSMPSSMCWMWSRNADTRTAHVRTTPPASSRASSMSSTAGDSLKSSTGAPSAVALGEQPLLSEPRASLSALRSSASRPSEALLEERVIRSSSVAVAAATAAELRLVRNLSRTQFSTPFWRM